MNTAMERARQKYTELFPDDKSKAAAFDAIAERYYYANFGATSKADLDVLMFSLYIEKILEQSEDDPKTYSDYTLSKLLGITQQKIGNLKVKKELQYPYEKFSWQKSFERIIDNYRYDNGRIMLFIPDKNLYLEIKNAIEECGGYVEKTLNSTLLQIAPEYFIDLLLAISQEKERDEIRAEVKKELDKHKIGTEDFEKKSIGDFLKQAAPEIAIGIVGSSLENLVPVVGPILSGAIRRIAESIRE